MYPFEIKLFAWYLSRIYWNKTVVHQGKVYDYPGMSFDFSEKRKVKIDMIPLLENIFESLSEEIEATEKLRDGNHFSKIRGASDTVYIHEE